MDNFEKKKNKKMCEDYNSLDTSFGKSSISRELRVNESTEEEKYFPTRQQRAFHKMSNSTRKFLASPLKATCHVSVTNTDRSCNYYGPKKSSRSRAKEFQALQRTQALDRAQSKISQNRMEFKRYLSCGEPGPGSNLYGAQLNLNERLCPQDASENLPKEIGKRLPEIEIGNCSSYSSPKESKSAEGLRLPPLNDKFRSYPNAGKYNEVPRTFGYNGPRPDTPVPSQFSYHRNEQPLKLNLRNNRGLFRKRLDALRSSRTNKTSSQKEIRKTPWPAEIDVVANSVQNIAISDQSEPRSPFTSRNPFYSSEPKQNSLRGSFVGRYDWYREK